MKTNYNTNTKDNLFGIAVLASLFLFIASIAAVANSQTVVAKANTELVPQQMETIIVTAQRMPVEIMNTIVVSASSHGDVVLASK